MLGGSGNDTLDGGSNNDILRGGTGNDNLTGGRGLDQFVFALGDGKDLIRDFQDGSDLIVIETGADDFSDLTITQKGADSVVTFGNVEITLAGIDDAHLTHLDFQFI